MLSIMISIMNAHMEICRLCGCITSTNQLEPILYTGMSTVNPIHVWIFMLSQLNQIIAAPRLLDKISGVSSNVCKCQYFMEINSCTRAGKLLFWLASMRLQLQQNPSYCSCDNTKREKHYTQSTIWDIQHRHMKLQKKDSRGSLEASVDKS